MNWTGWKNVVLNIALFLIVVAMLALSDLIPNPG
jgi:hypothetical protein